MKVNSVLMFNSISWIENTLEKHNIDKATIHTGKAHN